MFPILAAFGATVAPSQAPAAAPSVADQIIQIINDLCAKFGIAFNWTVDNVWPYIQQLGMKLVLYKLIIALVWVGISIVLFVVGAICIKKAKKCYKDDGDEDFFIGMVVCAAIALIVGIIIFLVHIYTVVTCLTFPEKIIYDYVIPMLR